MSYFFTADPHLGHANIMKYCRRPFNSVKEMDQTIVDNWNSTIGWDDTVYLLGDISMRNPERWLAVLQGKKILIQGNHDRLTPTARQLLESVHQLLDIRLENQHITLCHYPMLVWNRSFHGSWHLYGHSHGNTSESETRRSFDVGMDVWGFKPVPWEVIQMKMADKADQWDTSEEAQDKQRQKIVGLQIQNKQYLERYYT